MNVVDESRSRSSTFAAQDRLPGRVVEVGPEKVLRTVGRLGDPMKLPLAVERLPMGEAAGSAARAFVASVYQDRVAQGLLC